MEKPSMNSNIFTASLRTALRWIVVLDFTHMLYFVKYRLAALLYSQKSLKTQKNKQDIISNIHCFKPCRSPHKGLSYSANLLATFPKFLPKSFISRLMPSACPHLYFIHLINQKK
jgi:hypothetical protein